MAQLCSARSDGDGLYFGIRTVHAGSTAVYNGPIWSSGGSGCQLVQLPGLSMGCFLGLGNRGVDTKFDGLAWLRVDLRTTGHARAVDGRLHVM